MSRKQRWLAKQGLADTRREDNLKKQRGMRAPIDRPIPATQRETKPDYRPPIMPRALDPLEFAFGGVNELLPARSNIPDEFWRMSNPYARMVSKWFFKGINRSELIVKPNIDAKVVITHLAAIIQSFEPSHEHKEAGAAYLMSMWFDIA